MSKTYIVKAEDETQLIVEIGVNSTGAAFIATNPVSYLTPYTEPDVEQIREEAFKNGYDAACKDIDVKSKINDAYQKGLSDAWDAAKKIVLSTEDGGLFDYDVRKAVFGCGNYMALKKYSVSEAIEKIRQYEQEEIKPGDEIQFFDGEKAFVLDVSDEKLSVITKRGFTDISMWIGNVSKTGVQCTLVAEYLKKLREGEDETE